MIKNSYFKTLFDAEILDVKNDLIKLLETADPLSLTNWAELNLTKRPNVIESIQLYGFIKKNLRASEHFKGNYDPNLVSLTLLAFQGAYESMLRKSYLVLFEATKLMFKNKEWYDTAFKNRESKYNTAETITFINDCLVEENKENGSFLALRNAVSKFHLNRLNKIRNAVAHNMYVVEGDCEANSRICYSETYNRGYFRKSEYQTIKTAEIFKLLDMMDFFRDLLLEALDVTADKLPHLKMVFCQCGMQGFADPIQLSVKTCYFCGETGQFTLKGVSISKYLPPLP